MSADGVYYCVSCFSITWKFTSPFLELFSVKLSCKLVTMKYDESLLYVWSSVRKSKPFLYDLNANYAMGRRMCWITHRVAPAYFQCATISLLGSSESVHIVHLVPPALLCSPQKNTRQNPRSLVEKIMGMTRELGSIPRQAHQTPRTPAH